MHIARVQEHIKNGWLRSQKEKRMDGLNVNRNNTIKDLTGRGFTN
jgi:hypothetical protein